MMKKKIGIFLFLLAFEKIDAQELLRITLEQAKEIAIENNANMKYSEMDLEKANKKVWETIATALPQITGNISYNNYLKQPRMLLPGALVGDPSKDYVEAAPFSPPQSLSAGVNASMILFDGSYIVGVMSTRVFLKISELSKKLTKESVIESTVTAYIALLISEENFKIAKKNLENTQKNHDDTKASFDVGLAQEDDLNQMEILLSTQKNIYKKSEQELQISEMNLSLVLKKELETKYDLVNSTEDIVEIYLNEEIETNEKIKNFDAKLNLDFKITENNTETKKLLMMKEQAAFLPQLTTSLGYDVSGQRAQFKFFDSEQIWFKNLNFGLKMSVPIFSSGMRLSRVSQAKIDYQRAKIEETEKEKEIRVNLLKSKNEYEYSYDMYRTSKNNLKLAESINRKEQIRNKEGIGSSMNLTSSYDQLYKTQQEYLQSIFSLVSSKLKIDKILKIEEE